MNKQKFKSKIAGLAIFFFGRGIKAGYKLDPEIKAELNNYREVTIRLDIAPDGPRIAFTISKGRIYTFTGEKAKALIPDINIVFKNLDGALQVLLAREGIAEAYCRHRILVYGDTYQLAGIVRVMDIVENYLFPGFIAKKLMAKRPEKAVSPLRIYLKMLTNI